MVSIREADLARAEDADVLAWAAKLDLVVVTHDASTMTAAAYERLKQGAPMPGLVVVPQRLGVGVAVRRLVNLMEQSMDDDLAGRVIYL